MHKDLPRSLKRIPNEKQSGSEIATKLCGVSMRHIRGEQNEIGGNTGRELEAESGGERRLHSGLVIAVVPWLGFLQTKPAIAVATNIINI